MRDQPDVEEAREAMKRIVNDSARAAEIIDRLRSLYTKSSPQHESLDVNEIVREMVVLLRGEVNWYGVSIRTDLAADLATVTADRVHLQQVLMNLMLNGIEVMQETCPDNVHFACPPNIEGDSYISGMTRMGRRTGSPL